MTNITNEKQAGEEIVLYAACQITCRRLVSRCEGRWMQEMSDRIEGAKKEAKEGQKEGQKEGVKFTSIART